MGPISKKLLELTNFRAPIQNMILNILHKFEIIQFSFYRIYANIKLKQFFGSGL